MFVMTNYDKNYASTIYQSLPYCVWACTDRMCLYTLPLTDDRFSNSYAWFSKILQKKQRWAEEAARVSWSNEFRSKNVVWKMSVIAVPRSPSWTKKRKRALSSLTMSMMLPRFSNKKNWGIFYKQRGTAV